MDRARFERQLAFLKEIDKLKSVFRQSRLMDDSRRENDAEHAWHLALMAMVLSEYAGGRRLDVSRVIQMVLIHDLVEIDAGDTFLYDAAGNQDKREREVLAADRILGLLPPDQAELFRALWDEFEARTTPEARFAAALDRFQPVLQNVATRGRTWKEHGVRLEQVITANQHMGKGAPELWDYIRELLQVAERDGLFAPGSGEE